MVFGVIIYVDSYLYTAAKFCRALYVGVGGCPIIDLEKRHPIQ